jgi:hypothetical protein
MHLHTLEPWMFLVAVVLGAIYLLMPPVGRTDRDDP